MSIVANVSLLVEDPAGSGNWIDYQGGVTRKTGETAQYRMYYSFSSTEHGVFRNIKFEIMFSDLFGNIQRMVNVELPENATQSSRTLNDGCLLEIFFSGDIQPGQSGYINFTTRSIAFQGPNGYNILTSVKTTGVFHNQDDGSDTEVALDSPGPTWIVSAQVLDSYTKVDVYNGNIYTLDADAYLVEYEIKNNLTQSYVSIIGGWGIASGVTVDTLPTISGVTPEVLWSNHTPYTVSGNTVTWNIPIPNNYMGDKILLRVRYPKDQVDAAGGIAAIGDITNTVDCYLNMIGNVSQKVSASLTHKLKAIPTKNYGSVALSKGVRDYSSSKPIPGYGLYSSALDLHYTLIGKSTSSNVIPDQQIITDSRIFFLMEDDSVEEIDPALMKWKSIQVNVPGGTFEYQTNNDPDVWKTDTSIAIPAPDVYHYDPFPAVEPGDYITKWRIVATGLMYPSYDINAKAYLTVMKRTSSQKKIKSIGNEGGFDSHFPDGKWLNYVGSMSTPVNYSAVIQQTLVNVVLETETVNPGKQMVLLLSLLVKATSTVNVEGTHQFLFLPPGFTVTRVSPSNSSTQVPFTVTPDYNGTGKQLLHFVHDSTIPALTDLYYAYQVYINVSSAVTPNVYAMDAWFTLSPEQAGDSGITHQAIGDNTATDIYDLDGDGDVTELIAMKGVNIPVVSAKEVNIVKMSKSAHDTDFGINNDTQITENELFQYKITVRNDSQELMVHVVVIDIFPNVNDLYQSGWTPVLNAPIISSEGVTVSYSTSDDPIMTPISNVGTGTWSIVPPMDLTMVKAVKLDFGDKEFAPRESAEVVFDMKAPQSAPDMSICYNSVQYIASSDIGGVITPYLPAFSPPANARVTFRQFNGKIGDLVWFDVNKNGIQDTGEKGLNGILVKLYDSNMNLMYTTTTTDSPVDGSPGYYMFSGIWPGDYYVCFPNFLPGNQFRLTAKDMGADTTKCSKPNVSTGFTDLFSLAQNEVREDIDAGYVLLEDEPVRGVPFI